MSRFGGFAPVYDENSRVLILGSFPSVMSRAEGFYYGNPRNRFWKMLCGFFQEEIPPTIEGKRDFLLRHGIAVWDMVTECDIVGSADDRIRGEYVADIGIICGHTPIRCVLCNGTKSYELLQEHCPEYLPIARKMPSTSPANPRYREEVWYAALCENFEKGVDKPLCLR